MTAERIETGIAGLDEVLKGGLIENKAYVARGGPGTGKTTLGLHFLTNSEDANLLITLGERAEDIKENAEALGIDLDGVEFLDLSPTSEFFEQVETYDIFSPSEVERGPMTEEITEKVEELEPKKVFIDSMTQFRYLVADPQQFRKQVLSFLRFLLERDITVLFSSEAKVRGEGEATDADLQFLSDGVINLRAGGNQRNLRVSKFRGSDFISGYHSIELTEEGMKVFPRILPEVVHRKLEQEVLGTGLPELDQLLGGGIERGTVNIITGPTGTGKTTLGVQFMKEAAGRGERSVVFSFEEGKEIILSRCESVSIPARSMVEKGNLRIENVESLQVTPEEFADMVLEEVEEGGSRVVMIDSVDGYRLSMRGEELIRRLRALSKALINRGVTVLLINEVEGVTGNFKATEVGISPLADNIVFLRLLETRGELRKAIGVLKKRLSSFEKTMRELELTSYGIKVGKPLTNLRGILTGTPEWEEDYPDKGS